jgi:transketolase
MSSGVAYGELGPTHHSIEDFAWLRLLPNLTIVAPSDRWETEQAVKAAVAIDGPFFLRISRMPVPDLVRPADACFRVGSAEILRRGHDAAIICNGIMVSRAIEAAGHLANSGIDVSVINMASIAPLDVEAILAAAETGVIVTAEEHSVRGGLGGAVAEVVATSRPCRLRILGFPGFLPTGSPEFLLEHHGLTATGIATAVRQTLEARKAA